MGFVLEPRHAILHGRGLIPLSHSYFSQQSVPRNWKWRITVRYAVFLLMLLPLRPLLAQPVSLSPSGQGVVSPASTPPYSASAAPFSAVPTYSGTSPVEVVCVLDENGRPLIVLPGVTLTQIDALLKLVYQQNVEPLYSIQSFSAEGQVVDNMANLTINMRIHTQNEQTIRIPIGLKSGIFSVVPQNDLEQAIQYDGPSSFAMMAAPQGDGYDIILRSKPAPVPSPETLQPEITLQPASESEIITQPEQSLQPETAPPSEQLSQPEITPQPEQPLQPETTTEAEVTLREKTPAYIPAVFQEESPVPVESSETQSRSEIKPAAPVAESGLESQSLVHHITLRMSFPVTQPASNEFHLKAEFPPALNSQLQLEVPLPDAIVMYVQGAGLRQTVPFSETSTVFRFQGMRSDFELQWHEKQHATVQERVILQVENADITAKLTPRGIMFDAALPVMASGGTFDSFQLQLPPGAVYRDSQQPEGLEFQVQVLAPDKDTKSSAGQETAAANPLLPQVLQFQLAQPTEGPVLVRVQAETPVANSQNGWFEVCGFSVPGAEKQFGKISVVIPPETRLQQKSSHGMRPSQVTAVTDAEGIVSSFEYYEHPSSLLVQAVPQATRVYLRPEYQVQINRYHAILIAKLSYTIHGGQNELNIDMNGWRLTDIGPESVVNREELPFMEDGAISISLQEPVGKKVELSLRASRTFDSENGEIRFSFPDPKADFVEPAIVSIVPADNIELKTDDETPVVEMVRKSRRTTPLDIELPPRQQEAAIYQLDHPVRAEYRAKLIQQKQKIAVQSQTEVSLHTNERVLQTLQYTVEYEPISRLVFAVPVEWNDQNDLRVLFESRPLTLIDVPGPLDEKLLSDGLVLKQVQLSDDKIGTFQITLSFLPDPQIVRGIDGLRPTTTAQVTVPVVRPVLPGEQNTILETVHVRYPRGLRILHDEDSAWQLQKPTGTTRQTSFASNVYQSKTAASRLYLGVSFQSIEAFGSTTVEKGWVRSWLLGNGRFDCAVYQLTSNLSHLDVALPEQVLREKVVLKVDGKSVPVSWNESLLRIPLIPPPDNTATGGSTSSVSTSSGTGTRPSGAWVDILDSEQPHLVEIWYPVSMTTSLNHISLEMPKFPRNTIVRPTYCQLILPTSRHLLSCSQNWMPQYKWQWSSGFKRKSLLTQQELEIWIGMPHGEPISPAMNSYLFLSFQPQQDCDLDLADRSTLILVSSGLILLFGLILLYFPKIRYTGVLFTLLVLFVSIFVYRVSLMIVFLQAGAIGLVLALIALFLYRTFVSADPWRGPFGAHLPTVSPEYSKVMHKPLLSDEEQSDMARVKVSPPIASNAADSVGSAELPQLLARPVIENPLPALSDRDVDESHGSSAEPVRGDHA